MPRSTHLPPELIGRPFTARTAASFNLSNDVLLGSRFRRIHHGVYCASQTEVTPWVLISAACLLLPADAALSHTTALQWSGVDLGPSLPLHFSTNSPAQTRLDGVVLHRRRGRIPPSVIRGVPTLGPDRTFVDCATIFGVIDLIRAGDRLVGLGLTTPEALCEYAMVRHLDGVIRARRAVAYIRSRVDSIKETDVRLLIRIGRLPEPAVNVEIFDEDGLFLACGDLVYRSHRIIIEYDGWHHERDARQRQRDHLRRERLEAAGWRVIVITVEDLRNPAGIVRRVHTALKLAGYSGAAPVMSEMWRTWFRNL